MIVILKVAELMHDDVLNAMHRHLHQFDVKRDSPGRTATAPPPAQGADHQ